MLAFYVISRIIYILAYFFSWRKDYAHYQG